MLIWVLLVIFSHEYAALQSKSQSRIPLVHGNILKDTTRPGKGAEIQKQLLTGAGPRIEAIFSNEYTQRKELGEDWYIQDDHEMVFLLEGSAILEFDLAGTDACGTEEGFVQHRLSAGSYIYIPAQTKHRVLSTSSEPPAVWLAVHHDGAAGDAVRLGGQTTESRLATLLTVVQEACVSLSELVKVIYSSHLDNESTTESKSDSSAFTIADGLVEHLLNVLLEGKIGGGIVGEEEDSIINISPHNLPYSVNTMQIPKELYSLIDAKRQTMQELRDRIDDGLYSDLTAFIDPIDGTKEFINGRGEACTICVGFSDASTGRAMAGVVHRPITGTWAAGAPREHYRAGRLTSPTDTDTDTDTDADADADMIKGLLTSSGRLSGFTANLPKALGLDVCPRGGAGNKVLLLLEGRGAAYIQDRGLNRWDTCACEAVLEAFGGSMTRLDTAIDRSELVHYTYRKGAANTDFNSKARRTKYNSAVCEEAGDATTVVSVEVFKPYSNLCGLLALAPAEMHRIDEYVTRLRWANIDFPAVYD